MCSEARCVLFRSKVPYTWSGSARMAPLHDEARHIRFPEKDSYAWRDSTLKDPRNSFVCMVRARCLRIHRVFNSFYAWLGLARNVPLNSLYAWRESVRKVT